MNTDYRSYFCQILEAEDVGNQIILWYSQISLQCTLLLWLSQSNLVGGHHRTGGTYCLHLQLVYWRWRQHVPWRCNIHLSGHMVKMQMTTVWKFFIMVWFVARQETSLPQASTVACEIHPAYYLMGTWIFCIRGKVAGGWRGPLTCTKCQG